MSTSSSSLASHHSAPAVRYSLAAVIALAGTFAQLALRALVETLDPAAVHDFASYQALLTAVVVSALYCGRGPALLCLALCTLADLYLFIEPIYSLRIDSAGVALQLALFVVIGLVICWVGLDRRQVTEALRASALRTQRIVDTALDAVVTSNVSGVITEWNLQAERIFGWTHNEALGREITETIIPAEHRESHGEWLSRAVERGTRSVPGQRIELTALRRDGTMFPAELSVNRIQMPDGEFFSAFIRDISDRKKAEAELRNSEARLRTLAESLPNLVWTCNADGGCDYLSRQWLEYTGRPVHEQVGSGWVEHVHPDERANVQREWAGTVQLKTPYDIEFRIRRHDGIYRWFRTRAVPLLADDGQVTKWFGSSTDIEDYKQSELKLRTQLERLALLDRITRAIGNRLDAQSIFPIVLRSLEDYFAVDFVCVCLADDDKSTLTVSCVGPKSLRLAHELCMPEQSRIDIGKNGLSRCLRGEVVHESQLSGIEYPFPRRLASAGLSSVVFAPIAAESTVFGVLIAGARSGRSFSSADCEFLRQLGEHLALATQQAGLYASLERAYEDLRGTQKSILQHERLRALGQMASGIAHDINNALSPAALYTQSVREREAGLSEEGRSQLAVVERAIHDVSQTVARMREFYRPQEAEMKATAVRPERLLEEVIQLTRARWCDIPQERGAVIRLEREFAADVPSILGVENEIRDAVTNLILNAVDAMPDGGTLKLRVSAVAGSDVGVAGSNRPGPVVIEVSDTGIGMDEESRAHCFEPFFTTKGERGTGLGLAMVYGMMQRHRGEIEIDSIPGQGTTVRLIFYASAAADTESPRANGSMSSRPLHILLVDDDPLILEACRSVLDKDGHAIVLAEGGAAGIRAFTNSHVRDRPFDLVITDLGMPYVDGRQVAAALKARDPHIPIILLTGWGSQLRSENEIPQGVDRVLAKPPMIRELRKAVLELTGQAVD